MATRASTRTAKTATRAAKTSARGAKATARPTKGRAAREEKPVRGRAAAEKATRRPARAAREEKSARKARAAAPVRQPRQSKRAAAADTQVVQSTRLTLNVAQSISGNIKVHATHYEVNGTMIPRTLVIAIVGNTVYYRGTVDLIDDHLSAGERCGGHIGIDLIPGSEAERRVRFSERNQILVVLHYG